MALFLAMLPVLTVALLITVVETLLRPARTDWWRNVQTWAIFTAGTLFLLPLFETLQIPSLIDGKSLPFWIECALFFIVRDLAEYVFHRAQHRIPLLWSMHSLHHSDPEMSALTTQRHYWADQLFKAVTVWPASLLIITPSMDVMWLYAAVSLWHFAVHARLPFGLGRFSWLLNTPAYHRRHHSILPEHYDSNFAALFPIFDVICGSYHRPDGWPQTGLDVQPRSLLDLLAWPIRQGPGQTAMIPEATVPSPAA